MTTSTVSPLLQATLVQTYAVQKGPPGPLPPRRPPAPRASPSVVHLRGQRPPQDDQRGGLRRDGGRGVPPELWPRRWCFAGRGFVRTTALFPWVVGRRCPLTPTYPPPMQH